MITKNSVQTLLKVSGGILTAFGLLVNIPGKPAQAAAPNICTYKLYQGNVGYSYTGFIRGQDGDWKDRLTMTANNLPPGLYLTSCQNYSDGYLINYMSDSYISCRLEGTPTQKGIFDVRVRLSDGKTTVSRTISLQIR